MNNRNLFLRNLFASLLLLVLVPLSLGAIKIDNRVTLTEMGGPVYVYINGEPVLLINPIFLTYSGPYGELAVRETKRGLGGSNISSGGAWSSALSNWIADDWIIDASPNYPMYRGSIYHHVAPWWDWYSAYITTVRNKTRWKLESFDPNDYSAAYLVVWAVKGGQYPGPDEYYCDQGWEENAYNFLEDVMDKLGTVWVTDWYAKSYSPNAPTVNETNGYTGYLYIALMPASVVDKVIVEPESATVSPGGTQEFTARVIHFGPDGVEGTEDDEDITKAVATQIQWSLLPTEIGAIFPTSGSATTFTAGENVGEGTITATVGGKSGSAQITVVGPLDYIKVTPRDKTLLVGEKQQFTAKGYSNGPDGIEGTDDDIEVPISPTWITEGGIGDVNQEGFFTAVEELPSNKKKLTGHVVATVLRSDGEQVKGKAKVTVIGYEVSVVLSPSQVYATQSSKAIITVLPCAPPPGTKAKLSLSRDHGAIVAHFGWGFPRPKTESTIDISAGSAQVAVYTEPFDLGERSAGTALTATLIPYKSSDQAGLKILNPITIKLGEPGFDPPWVIVEGTASSRVASITKIVASSKPRIRKLSVTRDGDEFTIKGNYANLPSGKAMVIWADAFDSKGNMYWELVKFRIP